MPRKTLTVTKIGPRYPGTILAPAIIARLG